MSGIAIISMLHGCLRQCSTISFLSNNWAFCFTSSHRFASFPFHFLHSLPGCPGLLPLLLMAQCTEMFDVKKASFLDFFSRRLLLNHYYAEL